MLPEEDTTCMQEIVPETHAGLILTARKMAGGSARQPAQAASPAVSWIFGRLAQSVVIVLAMAMQAALVVADMVESLGRALLLGTGLGVALGLIVMFFIFREAPLGRMLVAFGLSCGLSVGLAAALGSGSISKGEPMRLRLVWRPGQEYHRPMAGNLA